MTTIEGAPVKVLWLGDGGCHTGFARVTHSIGERLVDRFGHEVHVVAVNHRGDDVPAMTGDLARKTPLWLHRPDMQVGGDVYGQSRFVELLRSVDPDVVVILGDAPWRDTIAGGWYREDAPGGYTPDRSNATWVRVGR